MKLLSPASVVCVVSLTLGGCHAVSAPDNAAGLSLRDFSLSSATYIVRAGETLETIAFRYDIPVATLRALNPAAVRGIRTGMPLTIRQPAGEVQKATKYAGRVETKEHLNDVVVGETAALQIRQAVPVATVATDQYLLNGDRYNRSVPELQQIRQDRPSGYVEQPGYPVEEVVEDENFVLPGSLLAANDDGLSDFVGGWQWPLPGQLARDYDPQRANGRGIEIVGLPGQQVFATRDGVVEWVARSPDGVGKVVIVRHDDDYLSIYSNAQDLFVSMKDTVRQGDPIASLGANANDEPLLRFEISKNGNLLNPMDFLSPR